MESTIWDLIIARDRRHNLRGPPHVGRRMVHEGRAINPTSPLGEGDLGRLLFQPPSSPSGRGLSLPTTPYPGPGRGWSRGAA
eukprot:7549858-Pyramimonas_sp.AAC.1